MQWSFQNVALPLLISVIAGLVVFYIQKYMVVWGRLSFFGYPAIAGRWVAKYIDADMSDEEVEFRQVGSRISGLIRDPKNTKMDFDLIGTVTRTRYIIYQFKATDSALNSCGAAVFKLSKDGKKAEGHVIFPNDDEKLASFRSRLERLA